MTTETVDEMNESALRICILTETFHPEVGGGETQARTLAQSLIARGMESLVLTRRSRRVLPSRERVDMIPVYRLWPAGRSGRKKWGLLISSFFALLRLRHEYDAILVSGFRIVGPAAVLASRLLSKGCVLKADSNGEMSGEFFTAGLAKAGLKPTNRFFRLFLSARNWILRRTDAFVAISPEIEAELQESGVTPTRIQAIPNCVDIGIFRPVSALRKIALRHALGLPIDDTIVVFTGRLVSYKGLPLLVRVWERLAAERTNVTLLIVGSGSLDIHNCEAGLRDYVQTHHLEESVIFAGAVDNVESYLQASDIFAFPTTEEAFGLSVVEAMACGLAVVTTGAGALAEIVADQESGILVRPDDFEGLFSALVDLVDKPEITGHLGRAARERVERRYSAEAVTDHYITLFNEVTAKQNGASERDDRIHSAADAHI